MTIQAKELLLLFVSGLSIQGEDNGIYPDLRIYPLWGYSWIDLQ